MNNPEAPLSCHFEATATIPEGYAFEHLRAESPSFTTFEQLPDGRYLVNIPVNQKDDPDVADWDLHDDLRDNFEQLVTLQRTFGCNFDLNLTVGGCAPDPFALPARVVIILAILQCRVFIHRGT